MARAMKKRKHDEELETGGASYFGSGVREDFFDEDIFKLRPSDEKRPACRVLGEVFQSEEVSTVTVLRTWPVAGQQSLPAVSAVGKGGSHQVL